MYASEKLSSENVKEQWNSKITEAVTDRLQLKVSTSVYLISLIIKLSNATLLCLQKVNMFCKTLTLSLLT